MKTLAEQLTHAYEALAFANIGERSGRGAMLDALNGTSLSGRNEARAAAAPRLVALGVGDYLPPPLMAYAIGACRRMGADLLLLARDAKAIHYLLDPYRADLAGIRCEVEETNGRGEVVRVLSRRSGVLFAVSGTQDDPVASLVGGRRGLLSGKSPVPVVVVSPEPRKEGASGGERHRSRLAAAH